MRTRLRASTKLMAAGLVLTLGWFLLEGCFCDISSKEGRHPGAWVACVNNQPTQVAFDGDNVIQSNVASFDSKQWDCTHPLSEAYQNSMESPYPIPSPVRTQSVRQAHAASSGTAYLPPQLRDLPFLPPIPIPANPPGCDSSFPDVLQTVHTNARVTRISTCPFSIKTTIPVVSRPLQIAITPDGSTALVTSFDNAVNFIDLGTNRVTFTLLTDPSVNPHGIAISPDGTRAYITSYNPSNAVVQVIDMTSRKVIATIPTITYPQGLALTPDGSQLWVTSPIASSVDVIDTLTNTSATGLGIGLTTQVAFNSNGTRAYITSATNRPGQVFVIDTATYKVIKSYIVGETPTDIKMAYGDEFLVVNNSTGNSISVIDLLQDKVITTPVKGIPSGISFMSVR